MDSEASEILLRGPGKRTDGREMAGKTEDKYWPLGLLLGIQKEYREGVKRENTRGRVACRRCVCICVCTGEGNSE